MIFPDPCIGYVFTEQLAQSSRSSGPVPHFSTNISTIPRTIVILGDTSDPSALVPLITEVEDRDVSLLVHEATDAYIPPDIDSRGTTGRNRTHEGVKTKAIAKGHSTPAMAGEFARLIGAQRLALNHIGAR
jgi:ribonuclease Z